MSSSWKIKTDELFHVKETWSLTTMCDPGLDTELEKNIASYKRHYKNN